MAIEKTFKPTKGVDIPEGTHVGLFAGLIHLGTQRSEYEGNVSYKDTVLVKFELQDVLMDDGRPVTITKRETNSSGAKSNLLKLVKAIKGSSNVADGVDFEDMVGLPVLLEITHSAKGNAKIKGYMSVPDILKKTVKPLMGNPVLLFDVEQISETELQDMPEWLQKVINERVQGDNKDVDDSVDF